MLETFPCVRVYYCHVAHAFCMPLFVFFFQLLPAWGYHRHKNQVSFSENPELCHKLPLLSLDSVRAGFTDCQEAGLCDLQFLWFIQLHFCWLIPLHKKSDLVLLMKFILPLHDNRSWTLNIRELFFFCLLSVLLVYMFPIFDVPIFVRPFYCDYTFIYGRLKNLHDPLCEVSHIGLTV